MATIYDEINWIDVGTAVRDRRSARGLSAEEAAYKLCLSKKQILALESGSSAPFPGVSVRSWCGRRYAALLGLDWERLVQAPPGVATATVTENLLSPATAATPEAAVAAPGTGLGRPLGRLLLDGAVLLLVVVITIGTAATNAPVPVSTPVAEFSPRVDAPAVVLSSADTASVEEFSPPVYRQAAAQDESTIAANPADIVNQAQMVPAATKAAAEMVIEIEGRDPAKQTDSFFVSSKEQAALLKKHWNDPGAGTRIDLPQGTNRRIPISANEIIRVAEGRSLGIFYQGRMVPARAVESGAWVSFVRKTSDAGD